MSSHAMTFQHLRWQILRNTMATLFSQSWWQLVIIGACCVAIWVVIFMISWFGFHEMKTQPTWQLPLDGSFMEYLFDIFFFMLTLLLTFSTGIILYSSLFSAPESQFLLTMPIPDDEIFAYKYQGAVAFSSWAFVLIGSPVLLAYGLEVGSGAPWYYYAILPAFFLGFLLIPGSIGSMLCLFIVNLLPRHRVQLLVGTIIVAILGACIWSILWFREAREFGVGTRTWFDNLLNELSFLGGSLVPFHWMSRGIKYAARGEPDIMAYNLALIWSHGLFLYLVTVWLSTMLYRRGFNRLASGDSIRQRYGGHWLDNLIQLPLFMLDEQTRMLIVKDFRAFRRDPAQWAQVIIFIGIGCAYFFMMRRFYEQDIGRPFKIGISMLTLVATSFLMCAYTGRFIFPMLSLEGNKFWILGLLPLDRSRVLIGKFVFSAMGCLAAGGLLILFSNLMLGMAWIIVVVHLITIVILALAFSGMAVGLGAIMPEFRENDPSKIAVGFGATVNLMACLLLMAVVIAAIAGPMQYLHGQTPDHAVPLEEIPLYVWAGMTVGIGIGVAAIWLPLRAGIQSLRAMEF
ncbi:MAG: hypothetical protein FJ303_02555 [Planctomycetes bacterium]|nr:hypothetical protein [Planctomycetota bacterium]